MIHIKNLFAHRWLSLAIIILATNSTVTFAETVEFPNGSVCAGCKVVISSGVIYKVTKPNSTGWDVPCQSVLEVDGIRYLTPNKTSIVYPCTQKKKKRVFKISKKTINNTAPSIPEQFVPLNSNIEVNSHSIEFISDHRKCFNCAVYMQKGYVVKIVEPKYGDWGRLHCGTTMWIDTVDQFQTAPCSSLNEKKSIQITHQDTHVLDTGYFYSIVKDNPKFWNLSILAMQRELGLKEPKFLLLKPEEQERIIKNIIETKVSEKESQAEDQNVNIKKEAPLGFIVTILLLCVAIASATTFIFTKSLKQSLRAFVYHLAKLIRRL